MAKFQKGDWVSITPTPDTGSDVWTSAHNKYCGKIGKVIDVNDYYEDKLLLRVSVYFDYKLTSLSGEHSAWFEDNHLIKSAEWEANRVTHLNKKFEEYKRFEANIKAKRDKILKDIFTDPVAEERKKKREEAQRRKELNEIQEEEAKSMEGWVAGDGWFVTDYESF